MEIRMLGLPRVTSSEGENLPLRGLQSWAVLARVLLSDRPLSRRRLAEELFPETVDPLGALRWCLASLRRSLGPTTMTGDPILANLPEGTAVDALSVNAPGFDVMAAGELLEDSGPEACGAEFETWLMVERARLAGQVDARLRRDVLAALTEGNGERALQLARHEVRRQPYEEGAHIHLIRALILSGRPDLALAHADHVDAAFRRELGQPPSPAVRSAARANVADPPPGLAPVAVVRMLLQSGNAAVNAGAVDAGIDSLRRAALAAEAADDHALRAESLAELGAALIHSVRGQDDEGVIHLRQAEELALRSQDRKTACRAVLELCYVDALAGRRPDSAAQARRALDLAEDDPARLATAHGYAGFNLADWGRFAEAGQAFEQAIAVARAAGQMRSEGWALGIGAWARLRSGEGAAAAAWARESLSICARTDWLAFRPWCEAVIAEAELGLGGDPEAIFRSLEPTLALSCQLGDPCWEAATARVLALSQERRGNLPEAFSWLDRAAASLARVTDPYAALQLRILLDRTRLTLASDAERGSELLRKLLVMAARLHGEAELDAGLVLRASLPRSPSVGARPSAP